MKIRWRLVLKRAADGLVPVTFVLYFINSLVHQIGYTFGDGALYYRATQAWLSGGDPWAATYRGIRFAGYPPSLLLSVPLQPFGEVAAIAFWTIAGGISVLYAVRKYRLPLWWVLFPPAVEGWLGGSPDIALFGLLLVGGGAVTALVKPYAIPAMIGEWRWRAATIALILGLVTIPFLPWSRFFGELSTINATLVGQTYGGTAWGNLLGMVIVTIALVSLGPRLGSGLVTPTLWPSAQLHYSVFSMGYARDSAILALALAVPVPGFAAAGVIVYAIFARVLLLSRRVGRSQATTGTPAAARRD